jgi:hypothetical protein
MEAEERKEKEREEGRKERKEDKSKVEINKKQDFTCLLCLGSALLFFFSFFSSFLFCFVLLLLLLGFTWVSFPQFGKELKFFDTRALWLAASNFCQCAGAELVSIHSIAEVP